MGVFVWKKFTNGRVSVGSQAGSIIKKRYAMIHINGKCYLSHRLAWFYVHGKWPKGWIDHINHDRLDNRIENLRDATPSQSACNRRGDKGRSLPKGVYKKKYGFEILDHALWQTSLSGSFPHRNRSERCLLSSRK